MSLRGRYALLSLRGRYALLSLRGRYALLSLRGRCAPEAIPSMTQEIASLRSQ